MVKGFKWYGTYHNFNNFNLHVCMGVLYWNLWDSALISGCLFWTLLVDIDVPQLTLTTLSQSWALKADFVYLVFGFVVGKNILHIYDTIDKNNSK